MSPSRRRDAGCGSSRCWVRRRRGRARWGWRWRSGVGGEIVACDSQQVYIGMDIGTAKPTADERRRVPHHALDLVRPDEPFHAARWAAVARAAIADIAARGRLPIVVGGTGLYYRALVDRPVRGAAARRRRSARATAPRPPRTASRRCTPGWPPSIPMPPPRSARAIWCASAAPSRSTSRPACRSPTLRRRAAPPADLGARRCCCSTRRSRRCARASPRASTQMIAAGFLDEVRALRAAGYGPALKPLQALGYGQLGAVLDGTMSLADAVAETVQATFAYARRQRTWFRKQEAARRFEAEPATSKKRSRWRAAHERARAACSARSPRATSRRRWCCATTTSRRSSTRARCSRDTCWSCRARTSRRWPTCRRPRSARCSRRCSASRAPSRPAWAPTAPSSR